MVRVSLVDVVDGVSAEDFWNDELFQNEPIQSVAIATTPPDTAAEPQPESSFECGEIIHVADGNESSAVAPAPTPQQPTPAESRRNAIQAVQHRYTWAGLEIAKRKAEIKELRAAQSEAMDELQELVGDGEWSEGVDGGVAENCCAGLGNAEWTVEVTAEVTGAGCPAGEVDSAAISRIADAQDEADENMARNCPQFFPAANAATPPDQTQNINPNHSWQSVPIEQIGFKPPGIAKILRDDNGIRTLGELEALGDWCWWPYATEDRNGELPLAWNHLKKLGPAKQRSMMDVLYEWWRRHPKEAEKVGRGYGQG